MVSCKGSGTKSFSLSLSFIFLEWFFDAIANLESRLLLNQNQICHGISNDFEMPARDELF
jgi:hypothetical protein